jgi:hypothetical protein
MNDPTREQIEQVYAKALEIIATQQRRIEALQAEVERLGNDPRLKLPVLNRKPASAPAPEAHP